MLDASVIICTHNPRADYLARVLESLRNQTLAPDRWELVIIDNASDTPLTPDCYASFCQHVRHVREGELGIAAARRRGMQEAAAELIIFVDDENVLDKSYLSEAIRIKREWPLLGAWGSGWIRGDYEVEPPKYLEPFLPALAIRRATGPRWSNVVSIPETVPWGAGLCVRKEVAADYCRLCERSSIQITGRRGASVVSGEDKEIAYVCCVRGLGIGVFPELKITHLIPKHRISADYLVRLAEGTALSDLLLDYKWKWKKQQFPSYVEVFLMVLKTILLNRGIDRRIQLAQVRALAKGRRIIETALRRTD
jgi:glycosyltransferase involved in cell wall biosynthesis